MEALFKDILKTAVFAPSGDNLQPWSFSLGENHIDLFSVETTPNLYDYKDHATYIAHGALIENIVQLAEARGYKTQVSLFPSSDAPHHISKIVFEKSEAVDSSPASAVRTRHTDRRAYQDIPIEAEKFRRIQSLMSQYKVDFSFVQDKQKLREVIDQLTVGDEMILLNKSLHDFFYDNVRWSDKQYIRTRDGMLIRSIAERIMEVVAIRILKSWTLIKIFRHFGLPYITYEMRRSIYRHSSGLGYFVIKSESRESYVETGRALEGFWLAATREGLVAQPLSSILFLYQVVRAKQPGLSAYEIKLIKEHSEKIYNLLEVKDGVITFCVRMGYPMRSYDLPRLRKDPIISSN